MAAPHAQRLQRIRSRLEISGPHAILLHSRYDIRWSCGFTGSSGVLLVEENTATLFTDGRYTVQAEAEAPTVDVCVVQGDRTPAIGSYLAASDLRTILVQGDIVTLSQLEHLREVSGPEIAFSFADGMLYALRARKTDDEVASIRRALALSESVLEKAHEVIVPGMSEMDLATELDYSHRQLGAEGPSFNTIVAFGSHAALPHARPGNRKLKEREVILVDFGCKVDGYCSDITRMFSVGTPDEDVLEAYQVVEDALHVATSDAKAGISSRSLDEIARNRLSMAGVGEYFTHGLGHGVGLEIHEWPGVNARNMDTLARDTVITIEPGVYRKGRYGIRIENMIRITATGCDVLNTSGTHLTIL